MKLKSLFTSLFSAAVIIVASAAMLQVADAGDKAAKAAKAAKPTSKKGAIEALDSAAKTLTVAGQAFKIADAATVMINGEKKELTDLQVKDEVVVAYTTEADGSMTATKITKGAAPKAAKKK